MIDCVVPLNGTMEVGNLVGQAASAYIEPRKWAILWGRLQVLYIEPWKWAILWGRLQVLYIEP
jgi:hypothetical protein